LIGCGRRLLLLTLALVYTCQLTKVAAGKNSLDWLITSDPMKFLVAVVYLKKTQKTLIIYSGHIRTHAAACTQ